MPKIILYRNTHTNMCSHTYMYAINCICGPLIALKYSSFSHFSPPFYVVHFFLNCFIFMVRLVIMLAQCIIIIEAIPAFYTLTVDTLTRVLNSLKTEYTYIYLYRNLYRYKLTELSYSVPSIRYFVNTHRFVFLPFPFYKFFFRKNTYCLLNFFFSFCSWVLFYVFLTRNRASRYALQFWLLFQVFFFRVFFLYSLCHVTLNKIAFSANSVI